MQTILHITFTTDVAYSYTQSSIVSVRVCVCARASAKIAEPIKMPFGVNIYLGSAIHVLEGV